MYLHGIISECLLTWESDMTHLAPRGADDTQLFTVGDCERKHLPFLTKINGNSKIKPQGIVLGNTTLK